MERVEHRRGWVQRAAALFTIGPSQRRFLENLSDANTGAYELVLTPLIFALIGYGIDRVAGTGHVLTVVLGIVGFVGTTLRLYFDYVERMKKAEEGKPWTRDRV